LIADIVAQYTTALTSLRLPQMRRSDARILRDFGDVLAHHKDRATYITPILDEHVHHRVRRARCALTAAASDDHQPAALWVSPHSTAEAGSKLVQDLDRVLSLHERLDERTTDLTLR